MHRHFNRAWLGPAGPILMALWDRHWINPQAVLRFIGSRSIN
jgi:hypothetical protein